MKHFVLSLLLLSTLPNVSAQVISNASGDSGSGYPALTASGFELETPDCVHGEFGAHVTQAYDSELDRNVFVFHSHIEEDNDRCLVFDRVRMEIKGSANSIAELQHELGDTTYYRWKFRLDENFIGASSFNHLYQNKAVGGNDTGQPIITITARANRVEVKHEGGDSGTSLGSLAQADIELFRGRWVEGYLRQVHAENGELDVTIKDMATGRTILEYHDQNIDLWRAGADLNRPKWGVYRSKQTFLQDEEVRFANFCVSELSEDLCPGEAVLQPDTTAPTVPTELRVTGTTTSTISLAWDASEDDFGVLAYEVYRNGQLIGSTPDPSLVVIELETGTTYTFTVRAVDAAGNRSEPSTGVSATTDDANALPETATSPSPADGATDVVPTTGLGWTGGANTNNFEVFFGTEEDPPSVGMQTANSFQPQMMENTRYYWRISSSNANGTVMSPVWSFTTGAANADAPWFVYRANQRPEVETNFFELNVSPTEPTLDELFSDPDESANSIYGFRSDTDENFRWRYTLNDRDSTITIVTRLKGIDENASGIIHLDIRAFGWRQKLRINSGSVKFERSNPQLEENFSFDLNEDYHVFRILVSGRNVSVYLDENATPFISGPSNDESDADYFEWGKSGGADYGAFIDWMAITTTGTFGPGMGPELPEDLILGTDPSGTFSSILQQHLTVFPNPANGLVTLRLPDTGTFTAVLYTMDGRAASDKISVANLRTIDVSSYHAGAYVLVVRSETGQIARLKLLLR